MKKSIEFARKTKHLLLIASLFIYLPAISQIKIDANGKVGINNSSPTANLDVTGATELDNVNIAEKISIISGTSPEEVTSIVHNRTTGTLGGANGFAFNPMESNGGLLIESFSVESAGIYLDEDFAVIYSPGDGGTNPHGTYGYLLKVIDEDYMELKWYLDGSGFAYTNSDENRKENIKEIKDNKDKIQKLKAVKYNFKKKIDTVQNGNEVKNKFDPSKKEYYGFIAQDVERIYPEIVDTDENGDKYVSYIQFIPILLSAINEQTDIIQTNNDEITSIKQRVTNLEEHIDDLQKALAQTQQKSASLDNNDSYIKNASLEQNLPNPFKNQTKIKLALPANVMQADLYIYNMQGKQIKQIEISDRGETSVTIEGFTLDAGMYLYTLIADGKEVDTKKMILTK